MAPTPVDPAAAVKLWLKAANSGEASDKWGRVQRASWMVSWLWIGRLKRNLFEKLFRWILQSFCAEAARSCVKGKDANLLSLVQFLFRDFDLAVVPVATGLHCIEPRLPESYSSFVLGLGSKAALAAYMTYRAGCRIPPLGKDNSRCHHVL